MGSGMGLGLKSVCRRLCPQEGLAFPGTGRSLDCPGTGPAPGSTLDKGGTHWTNCCSRHPSAGFLGDTLCPCLRMCTFSFCEPATGPTWPLTRNSVAFGLQKPRRRGKVAIVGAELESGQGTRYPSMDVQFWPTSRKLLRNV